MFYGHNWEQYSIEAFIREIDSYMRWYCKDRIKSTLRMLSPLDYRRNEYRHNSLKMSACLFKVLNLHNKFGVLFLQGK